ncbi:MAG TPA: class I SAM-dependent methyltransferase [Stellaceae bacterium]|nr:class I SAM-dependent methyltransferase [Stellaceae bacterium]
MTALPPDICPPALLPVLARYRAGAISAEIALMQCALALGRAEPAAPLLERLAAAAPEYAALARLAAQNQAGLAQVSAALAAGLAAPPPDGEAAIAAFRARFDQAVAAAPEAAVALYSLGSPEILARATVEIVARLAEWGLLGKDRHSLDIGCGIGRIERALAPHIGAITGIDVAPGMIAEARRRCHGLANAAFRQCRGTDLAEFADESFDLVLAVDSFPYLVAAGPAVVERHFADIARLLRAGGAFVILNFSYRGDVAADRRDVARLAASNGFAVRLCGARPFALWDGAAFLLVR